MKKLLSVVLGGLMLNVIALAPVKAEDSAAPAAPAAAEASVEVTAPAVDATAPAADASASASVEASAADTKQITFADGKTGEIHQDHVYITRFGGLRMAAPDGEHKLSDGTSINVKGGMLVNAAEGGSAPSTEPAAGSPEAAPEAPASH